MTSMTRVGIIHAYPTDHLVQSLVAAGFVVVIIGNASGLKGVSGVEAVISVPLWDSQAVRQAVRSYHRLQPFHGIVPVNEGTVVLAAQLCEEFGLAGMPVTAAIASRNKYLSWMLWEAQGIAVPVAYPIGHAGSAWPIVQHELGGCGVIKLVDSMNSQGVVAVRSQQECEAAVAGLIAMTSQSEDVEAAVDRNRFAYGRSCLKLMAQRFCAGVEVSVDLFIDCGGRDQVLTVLEKAPSVGPYFAETASFWPTSLSVEQERAVGELAVRAARGLGLRAGPAHVEIRYDHDTPKVLEAGLRPGGGFTVQLIERQRGFNVYVAQALLATGGPIPPLQNSDPRALLFGGIVYPSSGRLTGVLGMSVFDGLPGLERLIVLNEVGDQVRAMPEAAQPHYCYYLLTGESSSDLLDVHRRIQRSVSFRISSTETTHA